MTNYLHFVFTFVGLVACISILDEGQAIIGFSVLAINYLSIYSVVR